MNSFLFILIWGFCEFFIQVAREKWVILRSTTMVSSSMYVDSSFDDDLGGGRKKKEQY